MKRACVTAMAVAMAAGAVMAQPVQWREEDGGNGHWYELVVSGPIPWPVARRACEQRGGYLVTPTTSSEEAFVLGLANRAFHPAAWIDDQFGNAGGPWLGGFQPVDADQSQPWAWVSGEPWSWAGWAPGEPNGGFGPGMSYTVMLGFRGSDFYRGWADIALPDFSTYPYPVSYLIEWSADCNGDGIVDKGQILSGELADANNNGIPDGPDITSQPTDQASAEGALVSFNVQVVPPPNCTIPVTYRWQRRNPAVPDPAASNAWFDLADDGTFANTDRPTMTVLRPGPAIATGYRCKIGGGCGCEPGQGGFVYTNTVNFSVACPADFNADGGIDFGDVEAFFERWENGC